MLLSTPHHAAALTTDALRHLILDRSTALFAAAVESLPGASGERVNGHSWLVTDHALPIRGPRVSPARFLTFTLPTTSLTLPLANTVFQTGTESTHLHLPATKTAVDIEVSAKLSETEIEEFAHAKEDIREAWEELGELMELVGKKAGIAPVVPVPENSIEIKLSAEVAQPGRVYTQLPLRMLTPPRKVTAGMGNILRAIESVDGESKSTGASRELEKAFTDYTASLPADDTREKLDVFARLTATKPAPSSELLLAPGARIHRVLSGGGGWGSKAGLLSLDPQGETEVDAFAREFTARFDGTDGGPSSGMIVQEGEWVQFFVAEKPVPADEKGIRFGCVSKAEYVGTEETGDERVLEGVFGGFAEAGGVDIAVAGKKRRMDVPGGAVVVEV